MKNFFYRAVLFLGLLCLSSSCFAANTVVVITSNGNGLYFAPSAGSSTTYCSASGVAGG